MKIRRTHHCQRGTGSTARREHPLLTGEVASSRRMFLSSIYCGWIRLVKNVSGWVRSVIH